MNRKTPPEFYDEILFPQKKREKVNYTPSKQESKVVIETLNLKEASIFKIGKVLAEVANNKIEREVIDMGKQIGEELISGFVSSPIKRDKSETVKSEPKPEVKAELKSVDNLDPTSVKVDLTSPDTYKNINRRIDVRSMTADEVHQSPKTKPTEQTKPTKQTNKVNKTVSSVANKGVDLAGDLANGTLDIGKKVVKSGVNLGNKVLDTGVDLAADVVNTASRTTKKVLGGGKKLEDLPGRIPPQMQTQSRNIYPTIPPQGSAPLTYAELFERTDLAKPQEPRRKSNKNKVTKSSFANLDNFIQSQEHPKNSQGFRMEKASFSQLRKDEEDAELELRLQKEMDKYKERKETSSVSFYDIESEILDDFDLPDPDDDIFDFLDDLAEDTTTEQVTEEPLEVNVELGSELKQEIEDSLTAKLKIKKQEHEELLSTLGDEELEQAARKLLKSKQVKDILTNRIEQSTEILALDTTLSSLPKEDEDICLKQAQRIISESEKVLTVNQYFRFVEWIKSYMTDCAWNLDLTLSVVNLLVNLENKILRTVNISLTKTVKQLQGYVDVASQDLDFDDFMDIMLKLQESHQQEVLASEQSYTPDSDNLSFTRMFNTLEQCLQEMIVSLVDSAEEEDDEEDEVEIEIPIDLN